MVHVAGTGNAVVPSGCTLNVYVSNNNGSTWESFDRSSDIAHVFSSTGTQLRIKISATGHPNRSPFIQQANLTSSFGSMHDAAKDTTIKYKVTRKRLR
jgi:hypothetical protein